MSCGTADCTAVCIPDAGVPRILLARLACVYSLRTSDFFVHSPVLSGTKKGKSVPLQARSGPEGSRKLRIPDYVTTAQDSGKVVSLTHRPPLPPGNAPGTHFC